MFLLFNIEKKNVVNTYFENKPFIFKYFVLISLSIRASL